MYWILNCILVELPRYVRVNTIKTTLDDAIEHFNGLGYELMDCPNDITRLSSDDKVFWKDSDLNYLLVFPCGTDLHDDKWVGEGKLMLQDKASCLSAIVLLEDCVPASNLDDSSPFQFCNVIDACAAPGNKTTHAAALMHQHEHSHQLIAVDKDNKRVLLLKNFTEKAGANVNVLHQSFLDIDSTDESLKPVSIKIILYIFIIYLLLFR